MRSVIALAVYTLAAASPLWAQTASVTGPRTLLPAHVSCTDLPTATIPIPTIYIKGGHNTDGHARSTKGEVVVLNRAPDDGLKVGQRYSTRRLQGGPSRFPPKGEGFGSLRISGWVTVTAVDDLNALAVIDFACDGIEPGDYLEPFVDLVLPTAAEPMGEPNFADRANILFGADQRWNFGDGDTFSIDRGTVHGVAAGARFAIYRDRKDGLPLVYVGDAVVMEQGELTSKVVLVRVKDLIQVGDVVVPRRQ
jgi:hypothetical protein